MAVRGLDNIDDLVPVVQNLGRRHAGYGVRPAHFDTVGAALGWTLKQDVSAAFPPEVEAAWAQTYQLLATTMKQAATEPAPTVTRSEEPVCTAH